MTAFKLGINMAGAVSAGAYTAGVLDFLMEALEQWQTQKDTFRTYLANPNVGSISSVVPLHDVMIEIFTGASAGGMCAAIASVMVQQPFEHIVTGNEQNTSNTFYESWVNKIDIRKLLQTEDVIGDKPLLSLLDCTILDQIAQFALTPGLPEPRPYISENLTLFLCLTNTRGIPYRLYEDPAPSVEEQTAYYGDKLRFEITNRDEAPISPFAKPLPSGQPNTGAWPLLQEAAKASGAVPVALASRVLRRDLVDYSMPGWEPLCRGSVPIPPVFPDDMTLPYQTVTIDGGVTDNSPFQLAHDYLASSNPDCTNPKAPDKANAAVITVAPFPMQGDFTLAYIPGDHQDIWSILMSFFNVTLSQSRFLGESLQDLMGGASFSRFVIAPSDPPQQSAIQCGTLGAFGGFLSRDFRRHDFLLGRRNCQQFLRSHFCLVESNPIIADGLAAAGAFSSQIQVKYLIDPPNNNSALPQGRVWMPVIPLCGSAALEVPEPERTQIPESDLDEVVGLIIDRANAIRTKLAPGKIGSILSKALWVLLNVWGLSGAVRDAIKDALLKGLGDNVKPNN